MKGREKIHCKNCNTSFVVNKLKDVVPCVKCKKNIKIINNKSNIHINYERDIDKFDAKIISNDDFNDMFDETI